MVDLKAVLVSCSGPNEIVGAINRAKHALPIDIRRRLADIFSDYVARYDIEGTYERMNHRSVDQIFAEYQLGGTRVITSGEVDGIRYRLFESPSARPDPAEHSPDGDGDSGTS